MENVRRTVKRLFCALLWIGAGALILLSNYGLIAYQFSFRKHWPAIFVLIGISELIDAIG
ncbi:MAG: DUF5668 domain-containing protein [Candidatus Edwardsbacteria bacterium]|nr:DUF5668 domain-containing protein [Candidatus Edwardsbacteria bacterium]